MEITDKHTLWFKAGDCRDATRSLASPDKRAKYLEYQQSLVDFIKEYSVDKTLDVIREAKAEMKRMRKYRCEFDDVRSEQKTLGSIKEMKKAINTIVEES